MEINWAIAFLDYPHDSFETGLSFWATVTESSLSPMRGDDDEFVTLIPPDGDPVVKAQRVGDPRPRIHIDLHVGSIEAATAEAAELGATLLASIGYAVMRSPAGVVFCLVTGDGESIRPLPVGTEAALIDQVCIDIPPSRFDEESEFWAALTGWERREGSRPEFGSLVRPDGMPLRFLLQRLGDGSTEADVHLDIAAGSNVGAVVDQHRRAGADVVRAFDRWTVMRDPAGMSYCITSRDPVSGVLPD